jgi:hypothetical protein
VTFGPNLPEHVHSTAQGGHRDQIQKGRNRRKKEEKKEKKEKKKAEANKEKEREDKP